MRTMWEEIGRYVNGGARHRKKGWTLKELTTDEVLKYAGGELVELAMSHNQLIEGAEEDLQIYEAADIFGCIIHYCMKMGWTERRVEDALRRKLRLRFTEPQTPATVEPLDTIWGEV